MIPDDIAQALPRPSIGRILMLEPQLVPRHQPEVSVILWEEEVSETLAVESSVPSDGDVVATLTLLHRPIVVSLELHEGLEDRLVLMDVLVPDGGGEDEPQYY